MKVVKAQIEDIERLRPIALQWQESCNGGEMKIELDIETHLADLAYLVKSEDADSSAALGMTCLFLLLNDKDSPHEISEAAISRGEPVGYMGLKCFKSPLGNQLIANEHYLFVASEFRGFSTLQLIRAAREWARAKGCSHIIFNASNLASDLHDKVCQFYERLGMKKFETSYINFLR